MLKRILSIFLIISTFLTPSTATAQSGDIIVFDTAVANNWTVGGWNNSNSINNGKLQITYTAGWAGFAFSSSTPIQNAREIEIVGSANNIPISIFFTDSQGNNSTPTNVTFSQNRFFITANIPTQLTKITFQYGAALPIPATIELDSVTIRFALTPTATPTQVPQPTPITHPHDKVINATVNTGNFVRTFEKEMVGVQMPQWMYLRQDEKPTINQVNGLKEAIKAAGIKLIRYGGGLEANGIGWERTLQKERGYRNTQPNPSLTPTIVPITWKPDKSVPSHYDASQRDKIDDTKEYLFHYGTDDIDALAGFAQATGANVMLQINIAKYDPAMWADLLHYANIEKRYNFKYFEVGNEIDLEYNRRPSNNHPEAIDPTEYARRLAVYIEELKKVDPNIKIISGVPATAHNGFVDGMGIDRWSEYLIKSAQTRSSSGYKSDALSYHWYSSSFDPNHPEQSLLSVTEAMRYDNRNPPGGFWHAQQTRSWATIAPQGVRSTIIAPFLPNATLGITELNYEALDFYVTPFNSNHADAIRSMDALGRLAYNGIDFVTWYTGFGSYGETYSSIASTSVRPTLQDIFFRPTYHFLYMYGNFFGDKLVQSSTENDKELSVWGALDSQNPDVLYLMVTNTTDKFIKSTIALSGFTPHFANEYILSNPNLTDSTLEGKGRNHGTNINGVTINYSDINGSIRNIRPLERSNNIQGSSYIQTFAPYTATAIILNKNQSTVTPSPTPVCPRKAQGNATCDAEGKIDILDYVCWREEYLRQVIVPGCRGADFDGIGGVSVLDYTIWFSSYIRI